MRIGCRKRKKKVGGETNNLTISLICLYQSGYKGGWRVLEIGWWGLAAGGGLVLFMILSRSVIRPLKWIWFGVIYTALGALVLFLLNLVGELVHFRIPINPVTAFITGVLGLPGLLYLVLVKIFFLGG